MDFRKKHKGGGKERRDKEWRKNQEPISAKQL